MSLDDVTRQRLVIIGIVVALVAVGVSLHLLLRSEAEADSGKKVDFTFFLAEPCGDGVTNPNPDTGCDPAAAAASFYDSSAFCETTNKKPFRVHIWVQAGSTAANGYVALNGGDPNSQRLGFLLTEETGVHPVTSMTQVATGKAGVDDRIAVFPQDPDGAGPGLGILSGWMSAEGIDGGKVRCGVTE
jgi:hypothetical protein